MSNTADILAFQKVQFAFAQRIRDPQHTVCPSDVEPRRMAVYQELFYNNVEGFISNSFPLIRQIYTDEQWHALIRDYFSRHHATTPLFLEMPREFLKYLQYERTPNPDDPLFLYELAHFDWQGLALDIADESIDLTGLDTQGDLLNGIPVVSPLLRIDVYHFPVHQITPEFQPNQPDEQPTVLLRYRDRADNVHTLEINALTAHLLNLLAQNHDQTGADILAGLARQLQHANPEQMIAFGAQILENMRTRDVILGSKPIEKIHASQV